MAREIIQRKTRVSCIGDMRERVKIHDRVIKTPVFGTADFTEELSGVKEVWANVKTVTGKTFFSVNIDVALTHEIIIRYDKNITSENWVEYRNNNLKIVAVEDLDERHEFLKLKCTDRGDKNLGAAQA